MKRVAGLHVIVGTTSEARMLELACMAKEEGASVVQFRNKTASDEQFLCTALRLRNVLNDVTFIVNDRVHVGREAGADGVHLGQQDVPIGEARALLGAEAIIGVSTSTVAEALEAERTGANYLGFGHMFPTASKEKVSLPRTKEELHSAVVAVSIPVIAIGGITEANFGTIAMPGLGGMAVIRAISESPNPQATIRNLVKMIEECHATFA